MFKDQTDSTLQSFNVSKRLKTFRYTTKKTENFVPKHTLTEHILFVNQVEKAFWSFFTSNNNVIIINVFYSSILLLKN